MQNIFNKIDELSDEFVCMWEDICRIESPSHFKEGVDAACRYFTEFAKSNRWNIEMFPQEEFGDAACIVMNPDSKNQPITLSGHIDTVHAVGSFGTPVSKRDGDKLHAPGAMDCKGGVVAGFLAMKALQECGFDSRPIIMIIQTNEEVGSGLNNKATIKFMCQKASGSAAFLNLEGYEDSFKGKACIKRKGIAGFLFTVNGIETHASRCAEEGASAIAEAAHKIIELEKIKEQYGLTFNCGLINGGSASNTVPGKCEFKLDVRFSCEEDYKRAHDIVNRVANTVYVPGCSCTVTETNLRPAMEINEKNIRLLNKCNQALMECGLSPLEAGERTGGSDASDVSAYGIPCLDSLGVEGERAHSKEEYGVISSLAYSAKRLAAIICNI